MGGEYLYDDGTELQRLEEQLRIAVEALEFYADPENYVDTDNSCGDPECCGGPYPRYAVVNNDGETAREALATLSPKEA